MVSNYHQNIPPPQRYGYAFFCSLANQQTMHLHGAPGISALNQTAVEVTIWEAYLLRNKTSIARTLCAYSLDNGPWHETDDARFIFRFTAFDWSNNIERLLDREHISCEVVRHFDMRVETRAKNIIIAGCDADGESDLVAGLAAAGYHVECYPMGKAVAERSWPAVDLFIVERESPDIYGLHLCRHLRTHPATKNLRLSSCPRKRKKHTKRCWPVRRIVL